MASFFVEVHLSKAKLTWFRDGNGFLIASMVIKYSLRQMLRRVVADGSATSLSNALYDRYISRFVILFHGIWAKTKPDTR